MVEHLLAKEKVAGSIPVSRSNLSGLEAIGSIAPFLHKQVHTQPTQHIDHNNLMNAVYAILLMLL